MSVITGRFPALDVPIRKGSGADHGYWTKEGSKSTFTNFNSVDGFGSAQFLVDILRNKYNHTDLSTLNRWDPRHFGPWDVKSQGIPTPIPPDKYIEGRFIRSNNKPFQARVKRGEMVVSNYQKVNALLSYGNGGRITSQSGVSYQNRSYDIFYTTPFQRADWNHSNNSRSSYTIPGGSIAIGTHLAGGATSFFGIPYRTISKTDDVTPYNAGWTDLPFQHLVDDPFKGVDPDVWADLCTSTLGEANSRTVDILTAMAELPETIMMILAAVKEVHRLFKDARSGHLRFINRAKRVQKEHVERVHRINYESHRLYIAARNTRAKANIEKERQRAIAQARRNLAKSLEEFASAVTSLWLTFRYGIMPNVYLVQDLMKADQAKFDRFVRFSQKREIVLTPPSILGFTAQGDFAATARCFIKRKFDLAEIANKEYSFIPAVTLWELVPLSFVADWFVNIGDFISAIVGGTKQYTQASTISVKFEGSPVQYLHESGASVSVTLKGYTRKVIDPWHYCALRFDPMVDLQRQLDAASLTYQIFLKSALKSHLK